MIRWPLFVIGLGLMACAMVAKFQQAPLPQQASRVTVAEALALVGGPAKHFVDLEAQVDTSRRIYSTGGEVSRPLYTANPPDRVYPIDLGAESGDWEMYLGNMVLVTAGVESQVLRLQTVRDRALEQKQVLRERWLAPVQGSGFRLWALSAALAGDDSRGKGWLDQRQFQGYLIRFKDVEANLSQPRFEHDLAEIHRFAEKEFGKAIPDYAYILLTDFKGFPPSEISFYCPIEDSQETLFCVLTASMVTNVPSVLRGILEPSKLELYEGFAEVLKAKLPPRIGILTFGGAGSFNQRVASGIRDVFATGGVLAALGLVGIVWKRRRKSRRRAEG